MTVNWGMILNYLGMTLDYLQEGKFKINVIENIKYIL